VPRLICWSSLALVTLTQADLRSAVREALGSHDCCVPQTHVHLLRDRVVVCRVFFLTCLDQRQVSNPASVAFVNMLTWSQSNFNGTVSQPVIKGTSAFFSPRSHKPLPERQSQRRSDETDAVRDKTDWYAFIGLMQHVLRLDV